MRDQFKTYCNETNKRYMPFSENEATSIELLNVLKTKKGTTEYA